MMHKHTVSLCILMVLLALAPITCAALSYSVKISAPPALSTLLQQYLPLNHADPSLEPAVLESLQVATPDAARRLLETEGYFSPEVKVWRDDAAAPTIHVDVDPGTPVTVATVSLSLTGPIHDDADYAARYQALIAKWPLAVGQVFRQADWDAGKQQALAALLADRYPLAKISASRVDIDPGSHQSKVALTLDSGPEISFGALDIRGLVRYRVPAAQILAGYHPGTPYKLQSLQTMQSALEQSGLFSSVQVRSDLQRVSQGQVPVVIELSEIARKKLDLGLTYDTDVGGGTRIGYEQYNLFDRGWTGSALWSWNRSEQSLSFGLSLPPSSDGYVNSLTAQLKKTDIQGVATSAQSLGVWHTLTDERSELRFGSQFLVESRSVDGVPTQTSHALLPSVGWTRRAVDNFFRKGNLLALRELALRRTADRVDAQMRAYRADQAIQPVWQARERLMICIGPGPGGEKLVRSAKRLAASLDADWLVVYVETPQLQRLSQDKRNRVLKVLKLAQELGAETNVLAGADLPTTLQAYANSRNVSKLVVGKPLRGRWSQIWRPSLVDALSRAACELDVYVVAHDLDEVPSSSSRIRSNGLFEDEIEPRRKRVGYLASLGACLVVTLLASVLISVLRTPDIPPTAE